MKRHGHSTLHAKRRAEYLAWINMRNRCLSDRDRSYRHYGGRGIEVCDKWLNDFPAFLDDVGPKPSSEHSLDRIDNDGHYEPDNVRWATHKEQNRNMRTNVLIEFRGKSLPVSEWAERMGLKVDTLRRRLNKGWPVEKAMTTPVGSIKGGPDGRLLTADGRSGIISKWAQEVGVSVCTINDRLARGYSDYDAIYGGVDSRLKLTLGQAREVKRRLAHGESHCSLGRRFGVGHKTIGRVADGKTWADA